MKHLKRDTLFRHQWGFAEAQLHGSAVARLQEQATPRGLSPAQVAEWLTTGRIRSVPAASQLRSDPDLLSPRGSRELEFSSPPLRFAA